MDSKIDWPTGKLPSGVGITKRAVLLGAVASAGLFLTQVAQAGLVIDYGPATPTQASPSAASAPSAPVVSSTPVAIPTATPAPVKPMAEPAPSLVTVTYKGALPASVDRVTAAGSNEALIAALRKIVPGSWKAFAKDGSVKAAGRVSFRGNGRPWTIVLEEVLATKGIVAQVDWTSHEVTFSSRAAATSQP